MHAFQELIQSVQAPMLLLQLDVLIFTETWLGDTTLDAESEFLEYQLERREFSCIYTLKLRMMECS